MNTRRPRHRASTARIRRPPASKAGSRPSRSVSAICAAWIIGGGGGFTARVSRRAGGLHRAVGQAAGGVEHLRAGGPAAGERVAAVDAAADAFEVLLQLGGD